MVELSEQDIVINQRPNKFKSKQQSNKHGKKVLQQNN